MSTKVKPANKKSASKKKAKDIQNSKKKTDSKGSSKKKVKNKDKKSGSKKKKKQNKSKGDKKSKQSEVFSSELYNNADDMKLGDDPLGILGDMNKAYDNVNNLITEYGDIENMAKGHK